MNYRKRYKVTDPSIKKDIIYTTFNEAFNNCNENSHITEIYIVVHDDYSIDV